MSDKCSLCNGSGEIPGPITIPGGIHTTQKCPKCGGTGKAAAIIMVAVLGAIIILFLKLYC